MKNIIIGTAGHVDHGKTNLIRALTGIDTDRLKEEKKRGITIDLGFAFLEDQSGERIGIIDVPGHEKFIKNMLAGAGGVDVALLVVAADDGVMPQTREHLGILSLLGIKEGVVAITKSDLADPDWLELVKADIAEMSRGTFLGNAPVYTVSAHTGDGIDELKTAILDKAHKIASKNDHTSFRIPVDRVFSIDGFGTVITGTVIEGALKKGDEVEIFPTGIKTRVRNIQVHSKDAEAAYAGQRTAVNLAGLKKQDISRGDVIAAVSSMKNSMMLDVKLSALSDINRVLENGSMLHFYHGSAEMLCKLVLLDRDRLSAGESGYAQLRFTGQLAAKRNDRFVVRFYSPVETVGGGVILDSSPVKHRRKVKAVLESLAVLESGSEPDAILHAIRQGSFNFTPLADIRAKLLIDASTFNNEIKKLSSSGKITLLTDKIAVDSSFIEKISSKASEILTKYHEDNPLQTGMRIDEFRSRIMPDLDLALCDRLVAVLQNSGLLVAEEQKVRLKTFKIKYNDQDKQLAEKIEKLFADAKFTPPSLEELQEKYPKDKNKIKKILEAMLAKGTLTAIAPQMYFSSGAVDDAKTIISDYITKNGSITLAQTRDLMGASRKFALAVLEYFDRHGITKKTGDARILVHM